MAGLLPPFVDHHVHLQLIDVPQLLAGGLGGVVDLGGAPPAVASLAAAADAAGLPYVRHAGAFLAAPGGYPSARPWCPDGAVREIRSPADAAEAVAEQVASGATVVKVTLNTDAGPVPDRSTLAGVVTAAERHGVPVAAHVEGTGMTELAVEVGIHALAHTPWTEPLDASLVQSAVDQGQRWVTTLDIHRDSGSGQQTAVTNLGVFHAAGGRALYGTDLGNGDLPLGVNPREIAAMIRAGLDRETILDALTDPWPLTLHPDGMATRIPIDEPPREADVPMWFASAQAVRQR